MTPPPPLPAAAGSCQVEVWRERLEEQKTWNLATACGFSPGLELGNDFARSRGQDTTDLGRGVSLKWVPENWRVATAAGELQLGSTLSTQWERPHESRWQHVGPTLLGLASLTINDQISVHGNLGMRRDIRIRQQAALLNLAVAVAPIVPLQLFAEVLTNNRRQTFGGSVRTVGGRWWLLPEQFGVDVTASKTAATPGTTWSIGFGWYGIKG
jgi:hypothetical protein